MPKASASPDQGTNVPAGGDVYSAAGAITTKNGAVFITATSAIALTLALPTATVDDGKRLLIIAVGNGAHTVTTPANGINNSHTICTFSTSPPVAGSFIELVAYNGSWWSGPFNNVTVS